jgi:hypothetical protein
MVVMAMVIKCSAWKRRKRKTKSSRQRYKWYKLFGLVIETLYKDLTLIAPLVFATPHIWLQYLVLWQQTS